MMPDVLVLALLVGFFSSLHCFAMCGSIISALSFGLPADIQQNKQRMLGFILLYNLGRLFSYALAGLLLGSVGAVLLSHINGDTGHLFLRLLSSLILFITALYLAQWLPHFAQIEKIGLPIWRVLEPIGRRLMPIKTPIQAFLFGLIWGWLPCSMVYITLLWASANGAWQGAAVMFFFGLGTLPAMFSMGIFSAYLSQLARSALLRLSIAILLLLIAGLNLGDMLI